ncbi:MULTISPECIES: histidine phosphatase family protein [unclassified Butyrivibrio]|uniref:histidine phosphatase family protein n=1 Tax=unclassified Butyrivibrio TaxID=2639466 RepID=UPI0003B72AF3|nr:MULTISPECIES: histidine phosphatase family protein [unclassified Butyrivibrio]MDC7295376.1 histidine phosphatase family protein [Butyrivibrio sp. DSM 10294]
MKLLIIRHGESEADILKVHEGRADFELTPRGHKQAEAMAEYVASNYRVNKIYCSTLKRAAQSARHIAEKTGLPIIFDENLMEFNNGLLAGLSYEEANEKYPPVKDLPIDQAVYGQESKVEFRKRADEVLQRILSEASENDQIAVVSHGGMINQLYRSALKLPVVTDVYFACGDTCIHEWNVTDNGIRVVRTNMTEHCKNI